jgi:hypothetical protein
MIESSLPPVSTMPATRNSVPDVSMMSLETWPFWVCWAPVEPDEVWPSDVPSVPGWLACPEDAALSDAR